MKIRNPKLEGGYFLADLPDKKMLKIPIEHYEYVRGHLAVALESGDFFYVDPLEPCEYNRPCINCNKFPTKEGYDACIGFIPNIKAACCGHGIDEHAYILFEDGKYINGKNAIEYIKDLI